MDDFERLKRAVAHDACDSRYREPFGAVPAGSSVRLALSVAPDARHLVQGVSVLAGLHPLDGDGRPVCREGGALCWREVRMEACEGGYSARIAPAGRPHVVYYAFGLDCAGGERLYYVPRSDGRSTFGQLVRDGADGTWDDRGWRYDAGVLAACRMPRREGAAASGGVLPFGLPDPLPGFQVTVYDPSFETPAWAHGAVMYQVFPDRFARGAGGVREEGVAYHRQMGRPVRLHGNWDEPVEWEGEGGQSYDPVDFFGGTLEGVREKLAYLASLGVEALYLNPVFEARSNHRYDTADYLRIDPMLGTGEDFARLCADARELGISIVLDAVLSHTGDDSRYFAAAQDPLSPYRGWYDFTPQANGVPYRCWWGHPSLPEVDERDPSWQRFVLGPAAEGGPGEGAASKDVASKDVASGGGMGADVGAAPCGTHRGGDGVGEGAAPEGVLPHWIAAGARGYRLDVADEIPDDVLERIRASAKSRDPQALVIGEVWEDATSKVSYGAPRTYALGRALDSVMNYPLRDALLGFALGQVDAQQLAAFLESQAACYPPPLYACLMNLLGSHDVERVRSVLALGGQFKSLPRAGQLELVQGISPDQDRMAARLQRMVAALLYALPGMPCLYYGDEAGLQGGADPFCRATFPWGDPDTGGGGAAAEDGRVAERRAPGECGGAASGSASAARSDRGCDLTPFYRRLGTMRKGSDALRWGGFAAMPAGTEAACVLRTAPDGTGAVLAVANRAGVPLAAAFDLARPTGGSFLERAGGPVPASGSPVAPAPLRTLLCSEADRCAAARAQVEDGIVQVRVPACSTTLFSW